MVSTINIFEIMKIRVYLRCLERKLADRQAEKPNAKTLLNLLTLKIENDDVKYCM